MRTKVMVKYIQPGEVVQVAEPVEPPPPAKKVKQKKKTEAQLKREKSMAMAQWDLAFQRDGGWKAVGMVDPASESQKPRKFTWATGEEESCAPRGEDILNSKTENATPNFDALDTQNSESEVAQPISSCSALQPKDLNANGCSEQGGTAAIPLTPSSSSAPVAAPGDKENLPLSQEAPQAKEEGTSRVNTKRKLDDFQVDTAGSAKAACTAAKISERNRRVKRLAVEEPLPTSDVRGNDDDEETQSDDSDGPVVKSAIPQASVREFTEDDFQGYSLKHARRSELAKSKFAVLLPKAESLVKCSVCKSDDDEDDEQNDGMLTVILDPHYPFHPKAWNEHIQSEEHSSAVIRHYEDELRKISRDFTVIDGSRLRCTVCTGNWKKDKKAGTTPKSYEGIVILGPHHPFHPRAWEEHVGTWTHIDNEVARNKARVGRK